MEFVFTQKAVGDYKGLPPKLQALVDKQLTALLKDNRYPSLNAKKYNKKQGLWPLRISRDYRLYFLIDGDTYMIVTITKHPK